MAHRDVRRDSKSPAPCTALDGGYKGVGFGRRPFWRVAPGLAYSPRARAGNAANACSIDCKPVGCSALDADGHPRGKPGPAFSPSGTGFFFSERRPGGFRIGRLVISKGGHHGKSTRRRFGASHQSCWRSCRRHIHPRPDLPNSLAQCARVEPPIGFGRRPLWRGIKPAPSCANSA